MIYYSQFQQDQFTYEKYFINKDKGYFVDIGAHDGITFSNSKFFEELGWSGVCIEPNPKVFDLLQSNRKCKCVKKAISNKKGKDKFFQINEGPDMLSGLVDEFNEAAIIRINNDLVNIPDGFDYIDVEVDLFKNVVEQTEIDFLSLDTEGNELKILKTIDFDVYNIKVITLENNDYDDKFINFLIPKGYQFVTRLGCDEVYEQRKKQ
jgi:FkbM family methyltransferase